MEYLFYILSIPFLYFNYKIIVSDLKYKKIPNKYLGYLLLLIPFYYIYIFFTFPQINYIAFFIQILFTFLISFILYFFWIWASWDAKYLLVLALFIPYIWIIPFIWNISLITLAYLFGYFIYFYLYKITFNKIYRQSLWWNIKQDLNERWKVHKWNKWWNTYKIIFKFLIIFLLIFVSIRLIRLYFLKWFIQNTNRFKLLQYFLEKYNIYLIFLSIWIFILWLYLFKILINRFKQYLIKKLKLDINLAWNILLFILTIFLISFIIFEYYRNSYELKYYLFKIFTIYLSLYIIFKILKWAYKITFWIAEYQYIDIKDLKEGDIVDKEYLIKMFWEQIWLGHLPNKRKKYKKNKKYLLYPYPNKYFQNIDNPIDLETLKIIKKCYFITNNWHKNNKTLNFTENKTIKILNTFSFAPYIFFGFLSTFLFQDQIFKFIINIWTEILKNIMQK